MQSDPAESGKWLLRKVEGLTGSRRAQILGLQNCQESWFMRCAHCCRCISQLHVGNFVHKLQLRADKTDVQRVAALLRCVATLSQRRSTDWLIEQHSSADPGICPV